MPEAVRRYGFRVFIGAIWAGAVWYLVFGGVYNVFDIGVLESEHVAAMQRIDSLIARTDSLVQRGDSLVNDPLTIERLAREEYYLIRDGEKLYRFVTPDGSAGTGNEPDEAVAEAPEQVDDSGEEH
jgi:cell division protein FtsB